MIQYLVTESVRFCNKYRYGVPGCHLVVLQIFIVVIDTF